MLFESRQRFTTKGIYIQQRSYSLSIIFIRRLWLKIVAVILVESYIYFRIIDSMESYVYYKFVKVHLLQNHILRDLRLCLLECFIQLQIFYLSESYIYHKDSSGYICKNILYTFKFMRGHMRCYFSKFCYKLGILVF